MANQASTPQPPPPKPSLLQRLRGLWARARSGDVIVANIGQGASDVLVGKNILKIGTLDDPAQYGGPKIAIFTEDKQPFHEIPAGIPAFEKLPPGR